MPLFRYEAVDTAGDIVKQEMSAPNQNTVIEKLRDQGLLLLSIEEASGGLLNQ